MEQPRESAVFAIPAPFFALFAPLAALSKPDRTIARHSRHAAAGADPPKTLPESSDLPLKLLVQFSNKVLLYTHLEKNESTQSNSSLHRLLLRKFR